MNKQLITLLFFILAALLYLIGFAFTASIFLILGALAEMLFWVRLFRRNETGPGG